MGTFILLEIGTFCLSIIIKVKGAMDATISLAEEGYIIDQNKFLDKDKYGTLKTKKKSELSNNLRFISWFIPGVNVIWSTVDFINSKKDVKQELFDNDVYIKIPDHKVELLKSIDSKLTKLVFIANLADDKDVVAVSNNRVFVLDSNNVKLKYEKLLPLDYTLNEVKHLNNLTGYTYRVGTMDNENVAIIGIPSNITKVDIIKFPNEKTFDKPHKFEEMDLDDAKNKTFSVYPYTWEERFSNDIHKSIDEMKKARNINGEDSNNYYDNSLYEEVNIPQKEQNGLVLSRRLKK
ncbi:MAG: hypothetical protein IJS56_06430 [Bacilli bacterium]|nr:hypothetical protein [Bacilli bacterium]